MNNVDTVRMAKALLEASGFVVALRGDYDRDQQAFIELDDELKRCKKVNGELLTERSQLLADIEELKARAVAKPPRQKNASNNHWDAKYQFKGVIKSMDMGGYSVWTAPDLREAKLLRDAIHSFIKKVVKGSELRFRTAIIGSAVGIERTA